jgi:hypothetical protein
MFSLVVLAACVTLAVAKTVIYDFDVGWVTVDLPVQLIEHTADHTRLLQMAILGQSLASTANGRK